MVSPSLASRPWNGPNNGVPAGTLYFARNAVRAVASVPGSNLTTTAYAPADNEAAGGNSNETPPVSRQRLVG